MTVSRRVSMQQRRSLPVRFWEQMETLDVGACQRCVSSSAAASMVSSDGRRCVTSSRPAENIRDF